MDKGWMAVWPVAAFFLGGLATQLTGWLAHRRQQRERLQDAAAAFRERRENFELENLQRLTDALQTLGRTTARAHHADMMASRETRLYGVELLGEELAEENRVASQDVHMLTGLVLDDQLREQVKAARTALGRPAGMLRADPREVDAVFMASLEQLAKVQDQIAARIREIYVRSTADMVAS
ncbi:hypothetical protein ACGILS_03925 [Streptomyces albidoflavus]|uniref:hypothetical protein n=1 Tax=Streptomyces albidoflavus TaxID=1886 RepID=UPI0021D598C6|nr:hypothetical protein [Streptomyces albidoflavus]MCU7703237.1 hypothetical protein [Streptomyces albidoflavus]